MSKFGADPVASLALILTAIWPALFSHGAQGWDRCQVDSDRQGAGHVGILNPRADGVTAVLGIRGIARSSTGNRACPPS